MLIKICSTDDWKGLLDGPGESRIKLSRKGLVDGDRRALLKLAGEDFVAQMRKIAGELLPGDIPIFRTALGAHEGWGSNRNGDTWGEAELRRNHHRFVKDARYYFNHKNSDPNKSYGYVKLSNYNEPMRRVDVLVIGNGSKEAADRNGGLVLPDDVIHSLERGDDEPGSQACKVAFDICNICGNRSPSRASYCDEHTCIDKQSGERGFGCKRGLTKVAHDGRVQFVWNPDSRFFDMSRVHKPADRTAFGGLATFLQKAASENRVVGGAELAEYWARENGYEFASLELFPELLPSSIHAQVKLAGTLRIVEDRLADEPLQKQASEQRANHPELRPAFDLGPLQHPAARHRDAAWQALAEEKIALPLADYLQLLGGESLKEAADLVEPYLPGAFRRLHQAHNLPELIREQPFKAAGGEAPTPQLKLWAQKHAAAFSLAKWPRLDRIHRTVVHNMTPPAQIKRAMVEEPSAQQVADMYTLYKLSFLAALPLDKDYNELCKALVRLH